MKKQHEKALLLTSFGALALVASMQGYAICTYLLNGVSLGWTGATGFALMALTDASAFTVLEKKWKKLKLDK